MKEVSDALAKVTAQANEIFAKMGAAVEEAVKKGARELNVVEICRVSGLQIDERTLDHLQVDRIIFPHPWLHWQHWWCWRPLWCWWWHTYHPYYRCCPYWWTRCHWYAYPL